ncbi:cytochrome P450 2C19-like isoform X1 [Hemicordylus capensis]|uniref:cytochrome P450 2C19-like isoform X1 n=2 Tax=Hemicordylus capensis TaxID=884348 RepID=UPI0023036C69|nr:cytochrome P450 2C19-like isoform X1 [Hemicordylus capensis]XP_053119196.1 cytochrome P450 2C19-like isoform X1 [Hemicordylus capensis]XP_053119197.1 cytochrome P450 2C19-like isoform X1 [Hemicordylus capensis]XP_053119198.1 cytochrome P450 2C19-like isoform X1 [Hemicordylus capensis]
MDLLGSLLVLCLSCLFFLAVRRKRAKHQNLPPGPTPLPLIGNLLQLKTNNIMESLQKMCEKYGPVFTVYFGPERMVVLHSFETVKKVLVEHGDEFTNRGTLPVIDKINKGFGVLMSNGERWVQLRRFSLTTLRDFGMGKKSIEERIQEEVKHLVKELQAKKGQPFNPVFLFSSATCNVISHILLGERFDYQDQQIVQILHWITASVRFESSTAGQLYNLFPKIMDYLPGPHQTCFKELIRIQDLIAQKVKDHEETLDANDPRDYIDCFLIKMEQEKHNPKTEFTRENLIMTAYDIFLAGTETTSTTLRYTLMVLTEHPAVEVKIHEEIDRVIGRERPPVMKDRPQMPYTEAVLHEAQRFLDLLPLGFIRMARRDVEIEGFTIPQGTTIFPMLTSALHDPKQFKNPHLFDPQNFLDERGTFKKNGADIPFSAGKRNCLGEGLARMELFLYLTSILQNFRLKRPPGVTKIDLTPDVSGVVNVPRQVQICFCPR